MYSVVIVQYLIFSRCIHVMGRFSLGRCFLITQNCSRKRSLLLAASHDLLKALLDCSPTFNQGIELLLKLALRFVEPQLFTDLPELQTFPEAIILYCIVPMKNMTDMLPIAFLEHIEAIFQCVPLSPGQKSSPVCLDNSSGLVLMLPLLQEFIFLHKEYGQLGQVLAVVYTGASGQDILQVTIVRCRADPFNLNVMNTHSCVGMSLGNEGEHLLTSNTEQTSKNVHYGRNDGGSLLFRVQCSLLLLLDVVGPD